MQAAYKVYYADVLQHTPPDLSKLMPLQFMTREQTIAAARRMKQTSAVIWAIEEPDGARFERADIEAALRGETMKLNLGPGRIIVDTPLASWPTVTSTGGKPHKQHADGNVQLPPKRPNR